MQAATSITSKRGCPPSQSRLETASWAQPRSMLFRVACGPHGCGMRYRLASYLLVGVVVAQAQGSATVVAGPTPCVFKPDIDQPRDRLVATQRSHMLRSLARSVGRSGSPSVADQYHGGDRDEGADDRDHQGCRQYPGHKAQKRHQCNLLRCAIWTSLSDRRMSSASPATTSRRRI